MLKEFFVASRYNSLFYFSKFLAWIAHGFAQISIWFYYDFPVPLLSDLTEDITWEIGSWADGIRSYAISVTFPYLWEKIDRERELLEKSNAEIE